MNRAPLVWMLLAGVAALAACGRQSATADGHGHHHGQDHGQGHGPSRGHVDAAGPAVEKGRHGGRLLRQDGFALEVQIFEDGVAPEFRVHPMLDGEPVAPESVELTITLARITGVPGGRREVHRFTPRKDYLLGSMPVYEPHSFAVEVAARHAGRRYQWSYDAPEGRVVIDADMARVSGLRVAAVGPAAIEEALTLHGTLRRDAGLVRLVRARYPGLVRSVSVDVGDAVTAGQVLARVESNDSLQVYALEAPIGGIVTERRIGPGETAAGETLFEIADYARVWADLLVFPADRKRIRTGQAVRVRAVEGPTEARGVIGYVSPHAVRGQAVLARVELDNADGRWTPNQFVDGRVSLGRIDAERVVPLTALQRLRDRDVVFAVEGETYQALPVVLGRRDDAQVEILDGIEPGAKVVVANSFLIKADIEKSGAVHDH